MNLVLDNIPEYVVLRRTPMMHDFTLALPNGDSYQMEREEVMLFLKQIGVLLLDAERFVDYVWGFYSAKWHFHQCRLEPLSQDQANFYMDSPTVAIG